MIVCGVTPRISAASEVLISRNLTRPSGLVCACKYRKIGLNKFSRTKEYFIPIWPCSKRSKLMIFKCVEKTGFCGHRLPKRESREKKALRDRVYKILVASRVPLRGREISERAGLQYKQTIDALNALYNYGRVKRHGKKLLSKWSAATASDGFQDACRRLNRALDMMSRQSNCRRPNKLR